MIWENTCDAFNFFEYMLSSIFSLSKEIYVSELIPEPIITSL